MTLSHKIIVFINWLGFGILMPVLNLLLLDRGCTVETLSIAVGVYSVVVMAAEVPSGIIADIFGRRRAFFISCAAYAVSLVIMLFSNTLWILLIDMALYGIGRAFSSGSIDALVIESAIERNGEGCLAGTASSLAVWQCVGIASGSLIGGALPYAWGYSLHIITRLVLLVISVTLAAAGLRETHRNKSRGVSLRTHISRSVGLLSKGAALRLVLMCIFAASVMMLMVETYWQLAFARVAVGSPQAILGVICAAGFGATMLGSFIMGRVELSAYRGRWRVYLGLLLAMGVSVLLLAWQKSAAGFIILYILAYFFLGASNVPEQTLINSMVPNETRAAILSAASLTSQFGGVFGSMISTAVVGPLGFSGAWNIGVTLTAAAVCYVLINRKELRRE